MNVLNIAIGLVRHTIDGGPRWLARWNSNLDFFDFVIADRLEMESARETAIRETAWQLNLNREKDILVANMAQANMNFTDSLPGQPYASKVVAAFYNVELFTPEAVEHVTNDPQNQWITSQEICDGCTVEGCAINPLVTYLVKRSQVIQHWESSPGN